MTGSTASAYRLRNRRQRPTLLTLPCCLVLTLIAAAGQATATPGAQSHINRMLEVLGGREVIGGLRSFAAEADCHGPDGAFLTRIESFRPGAVYFHQQAGDRSTEVWSTADRTWRQDAETGPQELSDGVRHFVRGHEFHLLVLELETRFSNHRLGETDSALGPPCRQIHMEDPSGQPASVCLRESDGLPVSLEMNPAGAEGSIHIRFADWREIQGIRYFQSFVLTEGRDRTFTYQYRNLEPNAVAADRFVLPTTRALQSQQDALLEILRDDRKAHLTTDASMISSHVADSLVEVYAGEFNTRSQSQVEAAFRAQFDGATYEMWEDVVPPVIRLSADATMAWVIRRVAVRRRAADASGQSMNQQFTSAYTATYEQQKGGWRMTSVTSTFLPP